MLKLNVTQIRSEDRFVTIGLKDVYPSSAQEVPQIYLQGRSLPVSGFSFQPSHVTSHLHKDSICNMQDQARPSCHCKIIPETVGLLAAASFVIYFGLAVVHETFTVLA